jgi:hypothetical protein
MKENNIIDIKNPVEDGLTENFVAAIGKIIV